MNVSADDFDFDQWRKLAEQDPAAFFQARQKLIADFIGTAPDYLTDRLWQFQNTIDCARAEAASPMKAVKVIVGMMGEHLDALHDNMLRLRDESVTFHNSLAQLKD